jgi:hypothetical protein
VRHHQQSNMVTTAVVAGPSPRARGDTDLTQGAP